MTPLTSSLHLGVSTSPAMHPRSQPALPPTSAGASPAAALASLRRLCPYELREGQEQTLAALTRGVDVLSRQPTGSGKTFHILLPAAHLWLATRATPPYGADGNRRVVFRCPCPMLVSRCSCPDARVPRPMRVRHGVHGAAQLISRVDGCVAHPRARVDRECVM